MGGQPESKPNVCGPELRRSYVPIPLVSSLAGESHEGYTEDDQGGQSSPPDEPAPGPQRGVLSAVEHPFPADPDRLRLEADDAGPPHRRRGWQRVWGNRSLR